METKSLTQFPKINKNILLWALYDFANTPLTVAMGGLFLAQWVVLDNGLEDIWYGGVFTLATILLLFTSPFWGAWSDKVGRRMPFLKWTTIIFIVVGIAMGLVAVSSMSKIPRVVLVLGLFFVMQYVYQISLIFYNSLLDKLATRETRAKISGIGEAFGEAGWLVGFVMLLPFAVGTITLFGESGRGQVFLPATLALVLLGLPMVFWLKEPKPKTAAAKAGAVVVYHETIRGLKSLFKENKNVAIFLTAFMFVSDALLTASLYFAIFLDRVFQIDDAQKVIIVSLLQVVSTISAWVIGGLGDRLGIKKLLILACVNLTLIYGIVSQISSLPLLYVLAAFIGFGYGGFYTTSRAMLIKLSPPEKLGEYFGFYSTFQKFASIVGPLLWGGVILLLADFGVVKYRIGILSLVALMFVGTLIMTRVKEERPVVLI